MGIITLTDRISVSVRAKNETERNSQKRATGKNIANALTSGGNANISDDLADQIGNTSKPTIADEQGREWVAMSDIIAAGKKMQQEGAFAEKEVHDGLEDRNGTIYGLKSALKGPFEFVVDRTNDGNFTPTGSNYVYTFKSGIPANVYAVKYVYSNGNESAYNVELFSKTMFTRNRTSILHKADGTDSTSSGGSYSASPISQTINGVKYSYFHESIAITGISSTGGSSEVITSPSNIPDITSDVNDEFYKHIAGYLFGNVRHSGGSLIDWTKPDDEIEEDIRNLHETWDVSEHAGSVSANGTYVLAGPIEFNPGD